MAETAEIIKERAVLVGVITGKKGYDYTSEETIAELSMLAETAGAEVVGIITQLRPSPESATYIGEGKLRELASFCENNNVDLVIFDDELSGSQQRNIENALNVRVIDRTTLILDIFAARATSSEGKLQVELAQLRYMLPRLAGIGASLSRLGGGIGTRGPGESRLETDKRHIRRRIESLEAELAEVEKRRNLARKRRSKDGFQSVVLVGYTNAGKSTIMNLLTDAGVLCENKLFATLDPTARGLELPDGRTVMLLDTVGFIRKLPHHLIKAFRSTLEEAVFADLRLLVTDISNPEYKTQLEVSEKILNDLGCFSKPTLKVFNKCDINEEFLQKGDENSVYISATKNIGIDTLLGSIIKKLSGTTKNITIILPYSDAGLASQIREEGKIISEEYTNDGLLINAIVEGINLYKYEKYLVN